MKIEEAILYVLAERNGGLRTEQIADIINNKRLCVRKDGQPFTSAQVYAVVMHHPETFVKAEGRIMLLIWPSKAFLSYFLAMPFEKNRYLCYNEQY